MKVFFKQLATRDINNLENLLNMVNEDILEQSAIIFTNCNTIYIADNMRFDPIARFFYYILSTLKKKVILLDSIDSLALERAQIINPRDTFIAISFRHYTKEIIAITNIVNTNKVPALS